MSDAFKQTRPEIKRSTVTTYDSIIADLEDTDISIEKYLISKSPFLLYLLAEYTEKCLFLSNLDKIQRQTLLKAMDVKNYEKNDFVFKTGEIADTFYIVRTGKFKACNTECCNLREYYKGDIIGELAMFFPYTHKYSIQAITFGSVWFINRKIFRRIKITLMTRKRKLFEANLALVPLFKRLHTNEFITLADCLQIRSVKQGEFVYKQQSFSDGMYLVEKGIINVCLLDDVGKQVVLYKIKKGEYFGERSLITCSPRNSSAIAEIDSVIAFLRVSAFERLKGFCIDIAIEQDIRGLFGSKVNLYHMREIKI